MTAPGEDDEEGTSGQILVGILYGLMILEGREMPRDGTAAFQRGGGGEQVQTGNWGEFSQMPPPNLSMEDKQDPWLWDVWVEHGTPHGAVPRLGARELRANALVP